MQTKNTKNAAQSEPSVRCGAWLERVLLWLARRDVRKAQERMEWVEEILRATGRNSSAEQCRLAISEIKETADWMRPRSNDAAQRAVNK